MSKDERGFDYWERKLKLWFILHRNNRSLLMKCHKCLYTDASECPKSALKANMDLKIINASVKYYSYGYSGAKGYGNYNGTISKHEWFCAEWIKYE